MLAVVAALAPWRHVVAAVPEQVLPHLRLQPRQLLVRLHPVPVLRPLREQAVRVHLLLHLMVEVELVLVEVFPP